MLAHGPEKTMLKMPSKKNVAILNNSRATIGVIAGGGRTEKPFMKAGEAYHVAIRVFEKNGFRVIYSGVILSQYLMARVREKLIIPTLGIRVKFCIRRIYYTLIEIDNGFIDGRENKGRNRRKREKRGHRT